MKIAVAQINTTVGDFDGNTAKVLDRLKWAEGAGVDLVVFPELTVCGYPPRDLLEHPSFIKKNLASVQQIATQTKKTAVALGYVSVNETSAGRGLFNTAGILAEGTIQFVQHKMLLPEYDVFDEARHFEPATEQHVFSLKGVRVALSLCEDMWSSYAVGGRQIYRRDPMEMLVERGCDVIINLSASPYNVKKHEVRESIVCGTARRFRKPVVYCNLVGGNDELVFDGHSLVANDKGEIVFEGARFIEENFVVDLNHLAACSRLPLPSDAEAINRALSLGLGDYMRKCDFSTAVVGISGGIDSAVVAALAAAAIGPKKVLGVLMPSPYTAQQSLDDALLLCRNLSIPSRIIPIGEIYEAYRRTLKIKDGKGKVSLVEENLQARIRGNLLMAISNESGALVLSTGNKSELAVGYCTLYGDMAGGLAVISDVPKTMVYELARHINHMSGQEMIPRSIIERPPTAELKPHQTDQDILPDYATLDGILKSYVEDRLSIPEIVALGFKQSIVDDVTRRVNRNEYKRRQAPPGLKVTWKAFGSGRRFPIAWKS